MSYLVMAFFLLAAVAAGGYTNSPSRWRRRIVDHIATRHDWFTLKQVVDATRAPNDLVVQVISALARSGVLQAMPYLQVQVTPLPIGSVTRVRMNTAQDAVRSVLGPVAVAKHHEGLYYLRRLQFCVDRSTDPVSIPEMIAQQNHRKRPV